MECGVGRQPKKTWHFHPRHRHPPSWNNPPKNNLGRLNRLCTSVGRFRTCLQWCARDIFVESESRALRVRVESESSEILSSQSRVTTWSSQSRVTRMVESLRVIGLQARVNVESYKISNFFYIFLAIGPPVDLQWLQVRQWPSVAIGPPVHLQWL